MSNCLIFAMMRWWDRGGYVIIRRSHYGWWPHAIWSPDLKTFEQFHPTEPAHERRFPPLIFRGFVRTGTGDVEKVTTGGTTSVAD